MEAKYKRIKENKKHVSTTGHVMNELEELLAKDQDVVMAFNVLQGLWRARGEKDMKMEVEIGGKEANGEKTSIRLEVSVKAKYI